jgi:hypothetical protein
MSAPTTRVTLAGLVLATVFGAGVARGEPPIVCGTYSGRGCAPASLRVDLRPPAFSHPTRIDNPLFPISRLRSAVLLGRVEGELFRSETTLLPDRARVRWNGRTIRVRLSQYMAFRGGRLEEVALDRYAQADDGSVWYLGEDVFDYRHGSIASTEGTWLAGREGPGAMIMPGHPRVGDVYRTENIPGVVFEEVTVKAVERTVRGPHGPVDGAMVGSELHLDGARSDKVFAPGYGEFFTGDGGDVEALALAVPADAVRGPVPPALRFLTTGSMGVLENLRGHDWQAASATVRRLVPAWRAIGPGAPPRIRALLERNMVALGVAVRTHHSAHAMQRTIDVTRLALDLELRHRPAVAVDVERFQLWTQQLRIDAVANDVGGVNGDTAVLEWMRERVAQALTRGDRARLDAGLGDLRGAVDAGNLPAAADHAARVGAALRRAARI